MLANFKLSIISPSLSGAKEKLKPTFILIREREKGAWRQKKKNLLAVMCTCHCIAGDVLTELQCGEELEVTPRAVRTHALTLMDDKVSQTRPFSYYRRTIFFTQRFGLNLCSPSSGR